MKDEKWTSDNIPDLTGKIIIITGANSGIGFETAKEIARKGAQTILACRSEEKGIEAIQRIQTEVPDAHIKPMTLDLSSLKSVHAFAETFKASYDRLNVLINNAGIMWVPYGKTEDGFENHFGTNHLGHFTLTGLLIGPLLNTTASRVINVSSMAHKSGDIDFTELMCENGKTYKKEFAYSQSKLANLLFTFELQRKLGTLNSTSIAIAAHPGGSDTNLGRYVADNWLFKVLRQLTKPITQTAAMGALPSLRAATDLKVKGGEYYGPGGFIGMKGFPIRVDCSDKAKELERARRLWNVSEELTKISYSQFSS